MNDYKELVENFKQAIEQLVKERDDEREATDEWQNRYLELARKYKRWNYMKGIPVSSFMDSALRHIFKYLDGWDDEDHLSAAAFNILGAMQMEEQHKELNDLPSRAGKNTFDYKEGQP